MNRSIIKVGMLGLALFSSSLAAQNKQLVKLWETDSILKVPESVLLDKEKKIIYFSNIDGQPLEKDSKGSIGTCDLDGKNINNNWVKGISAPKGMAIFNNLMYVSNIDEVVVIDVPTATIKKRIPVVGAIFLNDVTINPKGIVYVTDSKTEKIHRIEGDLVTDFIAGQPNANGILAVGEDVYFLAKGTLWKAGRNKSLTKIADGMDPSTDGLKRTKTKDFIVSSWPGIIYYVKADGTKYELLDSRADKINTADIDFDADKNILYVPNFFKNKITAYTLK
ncbi:MAG TPA: ATP/GTP-binding protein [Bacteroidia bacterium]|nr:ATP/GTP-binding protein [Bacteroidia bacterium]HRG53005.1 ATP/GTP-binding protein [Bacteroidia bacterium]